MLPISTKDLIRFTPRAFEGRADAPVFLLRVPTLRERIALDAAISAEGVVFPSNAELAQVLRDAITEHVIDEEQPALIAIVEEFDSAASEGNRPSAELATQIAEMGRTLRRYHRPLAKMAADRDEYLNMAFMIRAETMVVGIEGENAPAIERRSGRLSERCVEAIEQRYGAGTVLGIGARCWELTNPTESDTKNSKSPPPLPPGPATSKAAKKLPTAPSGTSSAKDIHEIHGTA